MNEIAILGSSQDEKEMFEKYASLYQVDIHFYKNIDEMCRSGKERLLSISHADDMNEENLKRLKQAGVEYISTRSIGVNHINMEEANRLGIQVENVAYSPESVAEHTLMLMLMALRNMKSTEKNMETYDYRLPEKRFKELKELTVGVVGTGRIGQAVIRLLKGFGCKIICYDEYQVQGLTYVPYEELLAKSDIVTYHIPLNKDSFHMLNKDNIHFLKKGAYIINTARGALIDNRALIQVLESEHVSGAALDVIEHDELFFYKDCKEVETGIAKLCKMENVVITPHSAFYTEQALEDSVKNSILGCMEYIPKQLTERVSEIFSGKLTKGLKEREEIIYA